MSEQDLVMILLHVLMGLCLAACAGLRAWLPLLAVGLAGRSDLIQLNESFLFLESAPALILFSAATAVEIAGDKIPAVDHFLDILANLAKPIAAVIMMAAVLKGMDPLWGAVVGLIAAAPASFGIHQLKSVVRLNSSAVTLGMGNPILSLIEDFTAVVMALMALLLPAAGLILLGIVIGLFVWRRGKKGPAAA